MTRRRDARPKGSAVPEQKLSLREPADVLAAIPFVVGYHPTDSVVVLGLRGKRMVFTAREDLPPAGAPRREVRETVDHLVQVVARQQATGVLVVGFGTADRVNPVVLGLQDAYERGGLSVLEVLRASDGRYWSYVCSDQVCCPPEGSPYDANTSAVAAEWTVAGRVALPDRDSYEEQIRPVGGLTRISMTQATERADHRLIGLIKAPPDEVAVHEALMEAGRSALAEAVSRQRERGRLDDDEVAWLTVLLTSIPVRDLAWARIKGSSEVLELHRALWMDVMRRAEPGLFAAPGCLFAFAAYRRGEGALARLTLERVLAQEPDYNMARLLHHALSHGLPPSAFNDFPQFGEQFAVRRRPARRPRRRSSSRRAGSRRA